MLGVCACVVVCVLGMTRFETTRVASSALSPVNVGAQKSYMTPHCSWVLSKKKAIIYASSLFEFEFKFIYGVFAMQDINLDSFHSKQTPCMI